MGWERQRYYDCCWLSITTLWRDTSPFCRLLQSGFIVVFDFSPSLLLVKLKWCRVLKLRQTNWPQTGLFLLVYHPTALPHYECACPCFAAWFYPIGTESNSQDIQEGLWLHGNQNNTPTPWRLFLNDRSRKKYVLVSLPQIYSVLLLFTFCCCTLEGLWVLSFACHTFQVQSLALLGKTLLWNFLLHLTDLA